MVAVRAGQPQSRGDRYRRLPDRDSDRTVRSPDTVLRAGQSPPTPRSHVPELWDRRTRRSDRATTLPHQHLNSSVQVSSSDSSCQIRSYQRSGSADRGVALVVGREVARGETRDVGAEVVGGDLPHGAGEEPAAQRRPGDHTDAQLAGGGQQLRIGPGPRSRSKTCCDNQRLWTCSPASGLATDPQRLYVSQPALSKQIRALERQLGLDLLRRLPRGVGLPPEGETLLPRAPRAARRVGSGPPRRPARRTRPFSCW
jgi:hypothetical protein